MFKIKKILNLEKPTKNKNVQFNYILLDIFI